MAHTEPKNSGVVSPCKMRMLVTGISAWLISARLEVEVSPNSQNTFSAEVEQMCWTH